MADTSVQKTVKSAHFIGIGGAGMSGIALVLHERGCKVTGSDLKHSHYVRELEAAGIPVSIGHEAATIDGATRLQRIIHINLPAIMPTIVIMLIMAVGGIMNLSFEKVLLMQTDSNTAVSEVISTYVYKLGIQRAQYSLSAAVGLFNNIINLILLVTVNKVSRKISETSLW